MVPSLLLLLVVLLQGPCALGRPHVTVLLLLNLLHPQQQQPLQRWTWQCFGWQQQLLLLPLSALHHPQVP